MALAGTAEPHDEGSFPTSHAAIWTRDAMPKRAGLAQLRSPLGRRRKSAYAGTSPRAKSLSPDTTLAAVLLFTAVREARGRDSRKCQRLESRLRKPDEERFAEGRTDTTKVDMESSKSLEIICVDLDGTLIAADLIWESLLRLLVGRPWLLAVVPLWFLRGKAQLKREVAIRVSIDPARLPYRTEVMGRLRLAHAQGALLVLATGSDELYARRVGEHLGFFSTIFASDGKLNLTGHRKAQTLRREYGEKGFHYVGNDWHDLPVWRLAQSATVVAGSRGLVRHVRARLNMRESISQRPSSLKAILRAMRPHQWAKNALGFVPLITSHQLGDVRKLTAAFTAFLAFGFCASAVYVINDLLDIESDRAHPRKRLRPFAAGDLSVPAGVVLASTLLALAAIGAIATASVPFVYVLLIYVLTTTAYSTRLKREPVVDVFVLASLYVLRLFGGAVVTGVVISNWLLGFALFIFLSLAFVKRYTELVGQGGNMPGRGYSAADNAWMASIGISAGYMAVVILALYVDSSDVAALYTHPRFLWLLCPVILFWITRMWFRACRQQMDDDPVLEALRDPASYACALTVGAALLAAL